VLQIGAVRDAVLREMIVGVPPAGPGPRLFEYRDFVRQAGSAPARRDWVRSLGLWDFLPRPSSARGSDPLRPGPAGDAGRCRLNRQLTRTQLTHHPRTHLTHQLDYGLL
jgi:hypothetical protein